jgi:hypothetical protein
LDQSWNCRAVEDDAPDTPEGNSLPLPTLGRTCIYTLGETVTVFGFQEPTGHYRLRSSKCTMKGMTADELGTFLLSARAKFDGFEQ